MTSAVLSAVRKSAAKHLPNCKNLADAEHYFGGEWSNGRRDKAKAAVAWGLFDGYSGRPVDNAGIGREYESDYYEAAEIGTEVRLRK